MVFFDTSIWIELCCVATPVNKAQQVKAQKAASLISKAISDGETVVTCKEQLIEIISAVMKVKMREYNKTMVKLALEILKSIEKHRTFQARKNCVSKLYRMFAK